MDWCGERDSNPHGYMAGASLPSVPLAVGCVYYFRQLRDLTSSPVVNTLGERLAAGESPTSLRYKRRAS